MTRRVVVLVSGAGGSLEVAELLALPAMREWIGQGEVLRDPRRSGELTLELRPITARGLVEKFAITADPPLEAPRSGPRRDPRASVHDARARQVLRTRRR